MSYNYNKGSETNKNHYLSFGIGLVLLGGVLFASIIGAFIESPMIWAFGPGLGLLLGILIGVLMDKNTKDVKVKVAKIVLISIVGVLFILFIPKIIGYLF